MTGIDDALSLKQELLSVWDGPHEDRFESAQARFENADLPPRQRRGLAIGHSIDRNTRRVRLELRVTAASGPNHYRAQRIAEMARARGFETTLLVMEKPRVGADVIKTPPKLAERRMPLHLGTSIAHRQSVAGSLGAFVKLGNGQKGFVSCGHVLARLHPHLAEPRGRKWGQRTETVHQPGWPDQDPVLVGTEVAQLHDFAPFVGARPKNLDAAVALFSNEADGIGNVIPDLPCIPKEFRGQKVGRPTTELNLEEGVRVIKVGRTTGFTEASLTAVDFAGVSVDFETGKSIETFTFFGVHEVLWDDGWEDHPERRYSAPGDSGSLVMTREGLHPIGLHFTSAQRHGRRVSYVVPWAKIEATFGLELI
jgi:hypothetical protein